MKQVVLLLVTMIMLESQAAPKQAAESRATSHSRWASSFNLPFVLEKSDGETVYRLPMVGVKIKEILADGQKINPRLAATNYDGLDVGVTKVGEQYIYNLSVIERMERMDQTERYGNKYWIVTSMVLMNDADMELRDFLISTGAKEITVAYQIRYQDYTLSEERILVSRAIELGR